MALEARSADMALERLVDTVQADLAPLLAGLPKETFDESPTLEGAARRARKKTLEEIESLAGEIVRRTSQKRALHVSGEWMEWGAMRRLCDHAARDAELDARRTVFAAVYNPLCNYAVWLFNIRGEKLLANGIFVWLLEQAQTVSDGTALTLLQKNVKAGDGL
jgi:hypothetical protein